MITEKKNNSIERNVFLIAGMGGLVFTSLVATLVIVQSTLGTAVDELSNKVVPVQRELGGLSNAVGSMFLRESEIISAKSEELETISDRSEYERITLASEEKLAQYFESSEFLEQAEFPRSAAERLPLEVNRFLQADSDLLDAVTDFCRRKQILDETQNKIEGDLRTLLQQSASISGVLRLQHVVTLRNVAKTLKDSEATSDQISQLIYGDTRIQSEAIESLNLSALRLSTLAGRIALASNRDQLNALSANEVKQNRDKIYASLHQIRQLLKGKEFDKRVAKLELFAKRLTWAVGDESNLESLIRQRRQILLSESNVRSIRDRAADAALALKSCTRELQVFSQKFASGSSTSASKTISLSKICTLIIVAFGLGICCLAALRVRTSVLALRGQNEELSRLSSSLQEVNEGLEEAVAERTESLQLVLDNTGEGILSVDLDGNLLPEKSDTVTDWFGEIDCKLTIWDYLGRSVPSEKDNFWVAFDQMIDDVFPFEVSAQQSPSRLEYNNRFYAIEYRDVREGETLQKILVLIKDITTQLEAERTQQEMKDFHQLMTQLMKDSDGFIRSIEEVESLIDSAGKTRDSAECNRFLHTIKGNCAIVGFRSVSDFVHDLETELAIDQSLPTEKQLDSLKQCWKTNLQLVEHFVDREDLSVYRVGKSELEEVIGMLDQHAKHSQILAAVTHWQYEPTAVALRRLGDQVPRLASRLDKQVEVNIDDGGLRIPPGKLNSFWSSMVHVIRNAVDHGIESAEEREALGKPASATISLSSGVHNGWLELRVSDDGRGINWKTVKEKARANGLPSESQEELVHALFSDGLSTRENVTDMSGRGVGLSAVQAACEETGGNVSIQSNPGQGTEFLFRFPWEKIELPSFSESETRKRNNASEQGESTLS